VAPWELHLYTEAGKALKHLLVNRNIKRWYNTSAQCPSSQETGNSINLCPACHIYKTHYQSKWVTIIQSGRCQTGASLLTMISIYAGACPFTKHTTSESGSQLMNYSIQHIPKWGKSVNHDISLWWYMSYLHIQNGSQLFNRAHPKLRKTCQPLHTIHVRIWHSALVPWLIKKRNFIIWNLGVSVPNGFSSP